MEYYAKSKNTKETDKEIQEKIEKIWNLKSELDWNEKEKWQLEEIERKLQNKIQNPMQEAKEEKQKTLREHLDETVCCAKKFFEEYGNYFSKKEREMILEACENHDLGKANAIFQEIVNPTKEVRKGRKIKQIPHGHLSAMTLSKGEMLARYKEWNEEDFYTVVTAIYWHHTRKDSYSVDELDEYIKKYYEKNIQEFLGRSDVKIQQGHRNHLIVSTQSINLPNDAEWRSYQVVKGMLNKFDWAVSAGYEKAEEKSDLQKKQLVRNIEERIGQDLRPAQEFMRKHKEKNVVVIAPTGSGKTEAALLWLDGEKGFYTLPLIVSSNAIYDRIYQQYLYPDVALLHSTSLEKYLEFSQDSEEDAYQKYEKARLLSAPLTICTVDQLFKFVYKALGSEIFAASLKYSKIVLDEIQAYQPRVTAALLAGLKQIHQLGGHFAIITATFPPILQIFMKKHCGLEEEKHYFLYDASKGVQSQRHKIHIKDTDFDINEILEQGRSKKVLVICNTVKKAQSLYQELREMNEGEAVYLLHSKFIRKHRSFLEHKILEFAKQPQGQGIWVTTQIVEASLDIDFDILFTEMCSADSLLQRMGRCNRAERYYPQEANIQIFVNGNGCGSHSVYEPGLYQRATEYLRKYENIIFTEDKKGEYIKEVYNEKDICETNYYKETEKYLKHFLEVIPFKYNMDEANEEFRMIHSISVMPEEIYQQNYDTIELITETLKEKHLSKELKSLLNRKLNELTVDITLYKPFLNGVDSQTIGETYVHRTNPTEMKYEFEETTGQGRGLVIGETEEILMF
ncbi:MAG: CRISPR-associated helicase Cas3' [bacterium]|nr:CRISPR-associated helicase Cas3' [bacterium]